MTITFATNCWENDWKYLLKGGCLERMLDNCDYTFDKRILCIGNVNNLDEVVRAAKTKIAKGIIDEYIVVDEIAKEVLSFFEIDKEGFKGGYKYSISPLATIYKCETDLLLYFTGDAYIVRDNNKWVNAASKLLLESDKYFVANPLWNNERIEAKNESFDETADNYVGFGFSDQCFLVRTRDFKKQIYNEWNEASERYPKYGGEPFEKRVDSYMRNHNLWRITSNSTIYIHKNYRKIGFFRKLWFYFK